MNFPRWLGRAKRRLLRSYQDLRLRRALANEKRNASREAERRRAQSGSGDTGRVRLFYQRFQIWHHHQSERRAKAWARHRERYPWVRWIEKKQGFLVGSFFILLVIGFCILLFKETHAPSKRRIRTPFGNEPAVTVNGRAITMATYFQSLELAYGPAMLQKLTEQEAVKQEAARLKVDLSPEDRVALKDALKEDPQAGLRYPELETSLLIRKIILRAASRERKLEIYESFKDDLTLYRLRGVRFDTRAKAEQFLGEVGKGTSVQEAAKKYSKEGVLAAFDALTLGEIREEFGPATSESLQALKPGESSKPLSTHGGYAVYLVDEVSNSFQASERAIDNILVEAERAQLLHKILSKAKIESPYLQDNVIAKPTSTRTP